MLFQSNKDPRPKAVRKMLKAMFGFSPRKIELYLRALRHSSIQQNSRLPHNERLEFLGDAILDAVIADYLYAHFPDADEGQMTQWKANMVSREALNKLGERFGITSLIKHNIGKENIALSLSGNAMEALIGAMFIRKGYSFTRKKLVHLFKEEFSSLTSPQESKDHKSALFEWAQKNGNEIDFKHVEKEGQSDHEPVFLATVVIDGEERSTGEGRSKKRAEQKAAEKTLRSIQ